MITEKISLGEEYIHKDGGIYILKGVDEVVSPKGMRAIAWYHLVGDEDKMYCRTIEHFQSSFTLRSEMNKLPDVGNLYFIIDNPKDPTKPYYDIIDEKGYPRPYIVEGKYQVIKWHKVGRLGIPIPIDLIPEMTFDTNEEMTEYLEAMLKKVSDDFIHKADNKYHYHLRMLQLMDPQFAYADEVMGYNPEFKPEIKIAYCKHGETETRLNELSNLGFVIVSVSGADSYDLITYQTAFRGKTLKERKNLLLK